jgi:hypothetical protein
LLLIMPRIIPVFVAEPANPANRPLSSINQDLCRGAYRLMS